MDETHSQRQDNDEPSSLWSHVGAQLAVSALLMGVGGGVAGGVIGSYAMRDYAVRESRDYTDKTAGQLRVELVSKAELAASREADRNRVEAKLDALGDKIERITIAMERIAARR